MLAEYQSEEETETKLQITPKKGYSMVSKLTADSLFTVKSEVETAKSTPEKLQLKVAHTKDTRSPSFNSTDSEEFKSESSNSKNKLSIRKNQQWRNIMGSGERSKGGRRELSLRADVMNKNFFRALRRECKFLFEDFLIENGFTNSRSGRIFKANLRRFADFLLEETPEVRDALTEESVDNFRLYIGMFLNITLMKKLYKEECEKCNAFNDLLYSYSHKKFYEFVSVTEVSQLIMSIFAKKGLENFIRTHTTLATNAESYLTHIQKLISNIC